MKFLLLAATSLTFASVSFGATTTYVVTDVLCESGTPAHIQESATPGQVFQWSDMSDGQQQLQTLTKAKVPKVAEILAKDLSKQIIFVTGINDDGSSYKSGKAPCPKGDLLFILAKRAK